MRISYTGDIWIAILLASIPFINLVLAFAEGFSGRFWLFILFPIQIVPLLLAVVLFCVIVFRLLKAIFSKDQRRFSLLFLMAAPVVFFVAFYSLPPGGFWFLQGFRYGVLQRVSISEINQIAKIAAGIVPDGGLILPSDIGRSRGGPDNSARWHEFISQAPIGSLNDRFVVYNRDGAIQLEWGGALTGHWGLRVGQPISRLDRDYYFIPIDENIAAFFTD